MTATAGQIETISLLDTDDETDEKEVIELLDSDDEDGIVEIFCLRERLSEEQELDVSSIIAAPTAAAPTAATQQQTRKQKKKKKKKKRKLKQQTTKLPKKDKKDKKGLKMKRQQHQQQIHKQQQLLLQQQQQGQHIITMYVDGSYCEWKQKQLQMSAGIWVANGALSVARVLHGGKPESGRAELGSIYAAQDFLSTFGLAGLLSPAAKAAAQAAAESVQVWLFSDCQSCVDMLRSSCKVKEKYRPLLNAIMQLKAQLPFRVRIFKVQGHTKACDAHAVGNSHADKLARSCTMHEPVCQLPH